MRVDEQAVREVALELRLGDLLRGCFDVVGDALELKLPQLAVVDTETGAVVAIAWLTHRTHAGDVLLAGFDHERTAGQLGHVVFGQREDLAQMRVPHEREWQQLVPDGQALARLLGSEHVLELLQANGRPVAQAQAHLG